MSVQQYLRKYTLMAYSENGQVLDLSDLRFAFVVRRGDWQTPNSADIRVYNVAPDTANKIQLITPKPEFSRITISAGYEDSFGTIFDGQIKQVRQGRESQVDTFIDITGADGDSAYNFSTLSLSLAAGQTSPSNSVEQIIAQMAKYSVSQGYSPSLSTNPLPRGKAVYGMARDELRKVAFNTQTTWSIQDGKVTLVPLTSYIPAGEIPVITSATGMIGLPEQTQNGIKVRTLLNPNYKIGQAVKLDNESIQNYRFSIGFNDQVSNQNTANFAKTQNDGLYYVMLAEHSGDTRGNGWYSDLTCLAIDASIKPGYTQQSVLSEGGVSAIKRYG